MTRDSEIDFLRCVMNYMIVVMHAWAAFQYVDHTTLEFASCTIICEFLCAMALPTFFIISGYLMFQHFDLQSIGKKLIRRLRRLVVPYLVWNVTFVLFYLMLARCVPRLSVRVSGFGLDTWSGAIEKIVSLTIAPIDGPLWFLRALVYLSLLSPLLWLGLRVSRGIPFVVLTLVWGWGEWHFRLVDGLSGILPAFAIGCYVLGAWVSTRGFRIFDLFRAWPWLAVGIVAFVIRCGLVLPCFQDQPVVDWVWMANTYLQIALAPTLVSLVGLTHVDRWVGVDNHVYKYLKDMSFFAYAGHFMFCSVYLHALAPMLGGMTTGKMTLLILAFVGLGVPTMAVVYGVGRKICPQILKLWDGTL